MEEPIFLSEIEDILYPESKKEEEEQLKIKKEEKEQRKAEYIKNHPEQNKIYTNESIRAKIKQRKYNKRQNKRRRVYQEVKQMTQEEKQKYYDNYFKEKEQKKEQAKEGTKNAYNSNFIICFDLDYNECMDKKEKKSLVCQLSLCYYLNKHNKNKISFYLTGNINDIKNELKKQNADKWYIHFVEKPFFQIDELKKLNKEFVYLSPDAEEDLETVSENQIYIVGGLVDRMVIKNKSMLRYSNIKNEECKNIKIIARRLPLQKYIDNLSNHILNVNTVVEIISCYLDMDNDKKDWKKAIESALPKRKTIKNEE